MLLSLAVGVCVWSLFCTVVLGVLSSFAIISLRKRKLVALPNLSSCCHVAINNMCLLIVVPWYLIVSIHDLCILTYFGLECVIVAFPDHTRLLFFNQFS